MTDNSHFGLFAGAFAAISLISLYGSESAPFWLAPQARAAEIAVPGTIEPAAALSSFDSPRQLSLPPGLPALAGDAAGTHSYPLFVKADVFAKPDSAVKARAISKAAPRLAVIAGASPAVKAAMP